MYPKTTASPFIICIIFPSLVSVKKQTNKQKNTLFFLHHDCVFVRHKIDNRKVIFTHGENSHISSSSLCFVSTEPSQHCLNFPKKSSIGH